MKGFQVLMEPWGYRGVMGREAMRRSRSLSKVKGLRQSWSWEVGLLCFPKFPRAWESGPGSQGEAVTHSAGGWAHTCPCCSHTGRGCLFGWQPLSPGGLQPPPWRETKNTAIKNVDSRARLPLHFSNPQLSHLQSGD